VHTPAKREQPTAADYRPIHGHELSQSDHCLQWYKLATLVYSTVDSGLTIYFSESSRHRYRKITSEDEQTAHVGRTRKVSGNLVDTAQTNCRNVRIGNESVPIQLAQCWFPWLAISNDKM